MWTLILFVTAGYMNDAKNPSVTITSVPGFETGATCEKAGRDATAVFAKKSTWDTPIVAVRYTCAMLNKG